MWPPTGAPLKSKDPRPQVPGAARRLGGDAGGEHGRPGRAAGAAHGGDVHPHRRERPEDRGRDQEELPPEREHRERAVAPSFQCLLVQHREQAAAAAEVRR